MFLKKFFAFTTLKIPQQQLDWDSCGFLGEIELELEIFLNYELNKKSQQDRKNLKYYILNSNYLTSDDNNNNDGKMGF